MKSKIIMFLMCLLISTPAYAGYFIFHSGETITGKAASCGARCSNDANAIRVDQSTYESTDSSIHKIVDKQIVNKTRAELDAETTAKAQAAIDEQIAQADKLEFSIEDVIIALVKRINTRIPLDPITKSEVVQQLKDDKGL